MSEPRRRDGDTPNEAKVRIGSKEVDILIKMLVHFIRTGEADKLLTPDEKVMTMDLFGSLRRAQRTNARKREAAAAKRRADGIR